MKENKKEDVFDTVDDHAQHFTYREDCSTCYSNVKKFDSDDYEEQEKLELCGNCGMPCVHLYCDKCDKEISDYEFSRQDN